MQTPVAGVYIEKDAGNDNDLFLQSLPEEGHPVVQRLWELREICPNVKCAVGLSFHANAHLFETAENEAPLFAKMLLNGLGLLGHELRLEKPGCHALKRMVGATIKE